MQFAHTQWVPAPRPAPDGEMLFAVGDVHGHASELAALHQVLRAQIDAHPELHHSVVHLGDYIDRGPDAAGTLTLLAAGLGRAGVSEVNLVGNHDQYLIELLDLDPSLDRAFVTNWYDNGGTATMRSLGVEGYGRLLDSNRLAELRDRTQQALGTEREAVLRRLQPMHRIGDYVFVHAGIDPAVALDAQDFGDLLLMREPFLGAGRNWPHPFCVVHGHSIAMPAVHRHRIGVDAGCYQHGALCAVQVHGERLRFLGVAAAEDHPWQQQLAGRHGEWQWSAPLPVSPASAAPAPPASA